MTEEKVFFTTFVAPLVEETKIIVEEPKIVEVIPIVVVPLVEETKIIDPPVIVVPSIVEEDLFAQVLNWNVEESFFGTKKNEPIVLKKNLSVRKMTKNFEDKIKKQLQREQDRQNKRALLQTKKIVRQMVAQIKKDVRQAKKEER